MLFNYRLIYCTFMVFIFHTCHTITIRRSIGEEKLITTESTELKNEQEQLQSKNETTDDIIEKTSYKGAQVINIFAENVKHVVDDILDKGEAEKWGGNATNVDLFVSSDKVSRIKSYLNENNVKFKIVLENVQDAIDSENPPISKEEEELEGRKGHRMNWRSYHRLPDIYGYIDYLAETYPDIVKVGSLGKSVEGREIKYIIISSGKPNAKKFWLDGGIHAREWISPASVTYIISELVENRSAHSKVTENTDFYIVPVVNPDGYEYTHSIDRLWRKNRSKGTYFCSGTDLNRNWGYKWGGQGTSADNCRDIYRGTGPFSEPETRAVSNFILNNVNNMKAYVTFHSYGQYILIPFGFEKGSLPSDFNELLRVGQKAALAMKSTTGAYYTVGNSANLLYAASGGADDWAKGGAGVKYSYTIELRDRGRYGFVLPANFIVATGKEALVAVKTIAAAIQESN